MASREYSTWKRRPSGEKVLGCLGQRAYKLCVGIFYLMPRSEGMVSMDFGLEMPPT